MPVLILALGILAYAVYNKFISGTQPQTQMTQEDMLRDDLQKSIDATAMQFRNAQNVPLTKQQEEQIKKFSAVASIAGTATATSIAAFTPVTMAAAGPIGAAVAAAVIAIGFLRGTAHLVANEWTRGVQKPFSDAVIAIYKEADYVFDSGAGTKRVFASARASVLNLWSQYQNTAADFSRVDKDHATVIRQALYDRDADGRTAGEWIAAVVAHIDSLAARSPY